MLAPTPEEKKLASTGTSHAASASTSHQLPPRCICIRWWQLGAPSATTRRNAKHHSSREAKKRTETHASHHQFRPRLKIKKKKVKQRRCRSSRSHPRLSVSQKIRSLVAGQVAGIRLPGAFLSTECGFLFFCAGPTPYLSRGRQARQVSRTRNPLEFWG